MSFMIKNRYLSKAIKEDALKKNKIAFLSGPRQVGKSTISKLMLEDKNNYFLYDDVEFKKIWAKNPKTIIENRGKGIISLDEIHKDRKWKSKLKGLYDLYSNECKFLVTGSARLDFYRKGEDSLLGRYIPYKLHPFSVAEDENPITPNEILNYEKVNIPFNDIYSLGAFPEPLFNYNKDEAIRWSNLRLEKLVFEDSRDFLNISDYQAFRNLIDFIPEKIGSLLSINSLSIDVGKSYATIKTWIEVLNNLYFTFLIKPYSQKLSRTLKAEPKIYLYDILRLKDENMGAKLENLTALALLKCTDYWTELAFGEYELRFIRDREKREVDFVVLENEAPLMLVECKSSDKEPHKNLIYYTQKLKPKYAFQLVNIKDYDRYYANYNIRVIHYEKFLSGLI